MKGLLLFLFSAGLVLQSANAFPKFRIRHATQSQLDLNLSDKADLKREELLEDLVEELVIVVEKSIDRHKKLFENVLKKADEAELKSDALKEHLAKFSNLVAQANSLPEENLYSRESMEKIFNLFGDCTNFVNKYDELDSLTEEEKLIKPILDKNGGSKIILEFLEDFKILGSTYKTLIQEYVDSLSDDDKVKDGKFLEWFKKLKDTTDFDESVDVTMELFEFFTAYDDETEK